MELKKLNYLHVQVFLAVYRLHKATLAATELGLSTVGISRQLQQLNDLMGHPLFIRQSHGLMPTSHAEELLEHFLDLERAFQRIDEQFSTFIPSQAVGKFTILTYDEFACAVHEVIQKVITPQAPKLKISVHIMNYDAEKDLADGKVDYAVVYEGFDGDNLKHEAFSFPTDIYLMARDNHPLFEKPTYTSQELSRYPLVEIDNPKDVDCPLLFDICRQDGRNMHIMTVTESLASAVHLLQDTEAVTLVCNQFTRHFAQGLKGLACKPLPADIQSRVKAMCSTVRPIGNYVVYTDKPRSKTFMWVKDQLVNGLKQAWEEAKNEPD